MCYAITERNTAPCLYTMIQTEERKSWGERRRRRKKKMGQESAEGERMAQMAVGGNERLWRGDGAHEELMGWGLIA